ncbi:MAG: Lrp/AsnC family transcriptional regulator, partial [Syntrophomonadaceae bacterium]|nr:Lrp/AsnC family transcriptional regulator [Syntrophomonadaceae bacterium]
ARRLGTSEEAVVEAIRDLQERGLVRRFGAVLRHRQVGYLHNAMVMWAVGADDADTAGEFMAAQPEVSHCYLREAPAGWPFTLYTMIHARSPQQLQAVVDRIATALGISCYQVARSVREFKKTSMRYVQDPGGD